MANYTYFTVTASNQVVLHAMSVSPNNTTLKQIATTVPGSGYYGINGGFFDPPTNAILSIAVINDQPVKGAPRESGGGWFNAKYNRGTLIWDPVARNYQIKVIGSADDITVTDKSNYWAQGGISMGLQDDKNWYTQAVTIEKMPNPDGNTTRTSLVYNTGLGLWYVVTPTSCTATQFRNAIKEKIAPGTLYDGIFLDGGASTSMKCTEYSLGGRIVPQMIALINK